MTLLTDDAFDELFISFEHTAFRLETRESYAGVSYEVEPFSEFLATGRAVWDEHDPWLLNIRRVRAEGKRVERVRIVSEPWSDYTRYGLAMGRYTTDAGEDIRYLPRRQSTDLPELDYWLFDSCRLYVLHYGDGNDLLGVEPIEEPSGIVQANAWRDAAWHHAVPYRSYWQNESCDK